MIKMLLFISKDKNASPPHGTLAIMGKTHGLIDLLGHFLYVGRKNQTITIALHPG